MLNSTTLPAPPKTNAFQLSELKDRHYEILRLAHLGLKYTEIAKRLDITHMTVSNTLKSELGQEQLDQLNTADDMDTIDVKKDIEDTQAEAVSLLKKVMTGDENIPGINISLRLKAATELLDRGGNSRIQRIQGEVNHGYIGDLGLESIKERAKEIAAERAEERKKMIIEGEFTAVEAKPTETECRQIDGVAAGEKEE